MSKKARRVLLMIAAVALVAIPVVEWTRATFFPLLWPDVLLDVSRLLGLTGFVVIFFQFVLASRVRVFERSIGLDRLLAAHRVTGITALILLLLHGATNTAYELVLGFIDTSWEKLLGVGALLVLILVAGAALAWKSLGWKYETWKRIHYASYVILPLGFLHAFLLGSTLNASTLLEGYFIALVAIFVVLVGSRIARRISVRSVPHTVAEVTRESHDVVSLSFDGPIAEFAPGQFMLINLANGRGYSEAHPYTISSAPEDGRLRLSAKAIGDFSGSLADVTPGTKALIEAPYGVFSYTNVPGERLVFIAGGIGITPFLSQLRSMRARGDRRQVRLIWGNKTQRDISFVEELAAAERELPGFSVVHVLSGEEWEGESGYITGELIARHVEDVAGVEFFVCGPPAMMEKLVPQIRGLGVPGSRIHFERFAL